MKAVLAISSIVALVSAGIACSSTTTVNDTSSSSSSTSSSSSSSGTSGDGGPSGPACTDDATLEDLFSNAKPGPFSGPTPLLRAVPDPEGVAALWFDGIQTLKLRRWGLDGTPLLEETNVATKITLPGGDSGLGSIAVGYANGSWLVAWENYMSKDISARIVDASGNAIDAAKPAPIRAGEPLESPRVQGRGERFFLGYGERDPKSGSQTAFAVFQAYETAGKNTALGTHASADWPASDIAMGDGTTKLAHYEQGAGSIYDDDVYVSQAEADTAVSDWVKTKVDLPRPPKGIDMLRSYPQVLAVSGGAFFVDGAGWEEGGTRKLRVEIAALGADGALTKDWSIDVAAGRRYLANPQIASEGDRVYVAWIDATEPTDAQDALLHVWMLDQGSGATKTTEVKLALGKAGIFDSLQRPIQGLSVKNGAVIVPYVFTTRDVNSNRIQHLTVRVVCMASR